MQQAEKAAEFGHAVTAGLVRIGGVVNSAVADLTTFTEAATDHATDLAQPISQTATQHANSAGDTTPAFHFVADDSEPAADSSPGCSVDGVHFAAAPSSGSEGYTDVTTFLANADSFWFDASGPVPLQLDAQHTNVPVTGLVTFDDATNPSAPDVDGTFTSAASSSFQYSGPGILDTAPGGAHVSSPDAMLADVAQSFAAAANNSSANTQLQSVANIENFAATGSGLNAAFPGTSLAAMSLGSAPVLQAWRGDMGDGGGSVAAGTTSGSSGGVAGTLSATNGHGFTLNVVYDPSVASAPPGFTQTIANVVNFYESVFSTPVTITIDVGFGEVDGQAMVTGALGEALPYLTSVSYAQLEAALVNNANAIGDTAAAQSLSSTSPVNGQYWIATAEAEALAGC